MSVGQSIGVLIDAGVRRVVDFYHDYSEPTFEFIFGCTELSAPTCEDNVFFYRIMLFVLCTLVFMRRMMPETATWSLNWFLFICCLPFTFIYLNVYVRFNTWRKIKLVTLTSNCAAEANGEIRYNTMEQYIYVPAYNLNVRVNNWNTWTPDTNMKGGTLNESMIIDSVMEQSPLPSCVVAIECDGIVMGMGSRIKVNGFNVLFTAVHVMHACKDNFPSLHKRGKSIRIGPDWKFYAYNVDADWCMLLVPDSVFTSLGVSVGRTKIACPSSVICSLHGYDAAGDEVRSKGSMTPQRSTAYLCTHKASTIRKWSGTPILDLQGFILGIHLAKTKNMTYNKGILFPSYLTRSLSSKFLDKENLETWYEKENVNFTDREEEDDDFWTKQNVFQNGKWMKFNYKGSDVNYDDDLSAFDGTTYRGGVTGSWAEAMERVYRDIEDESGIPTLKSKCTKQIVKDLISDADNVDNISTIPITLQLDILKEAINKTDYLITKDSHTLLNAPKYIIPNTNGIWSNDMPLIAEAYPPTKYVGRIVDGIATVVDTIDSDGEQLIISAEPIYEDPILIEVKDQGSLIKNNILKLSNLVNFSDYGLMNKLKNVGIIQILRDMSGYGTTLPSLHRPYSRDHIDLPQSLWLNSDERFAIEELLQTKAMNENAELHGLPKAQKLRVLVKLVEKLIELYGPEKISSLVESLSAFCDVDEFQVTFDEGELNFTLGKGWSRTATYENCCKLQREGIDDINLWAIVSKRFELATSNKKDVLKFFATAGFGSNPEVPEDSINLEEIGKLQTLNTQDLSNILYSYCKAIGRDAVIEARSGKCSISERKYMDSIAIHKDGNQNDHSLLESGILPNQVSLNSPAPWKGANSQEKNSNSLEVTNGKSKKSFKKKGKSKVSHMLDFRIASSMPQNLQNQTKLGKDSKVFGGIKGTIL